MKDAPERHVFTRKRFHLGYEHGEGGGVCGVRTPDGHRNTVHRYNTYVVHRHVARMKIMANGEWKQVGLLRQLYRSCCHEQWLLLLHT